MTNLENLSLLPPCMFANGTNSVHVNHNQDSSASCAWRQSVADDVSSDNAYPESNVPPENWLNSSLTNDSPPINTSKVESTAWKSHYHERVSVSDDGMHYCENASTESEQVNVPCWTSELLDDENTEDRCAEESSTWRVNLPAIESESPVNKNRSIGDLKGRSMSRLSKVKKRVSSSNYKHIPHRDKPPQLVARRNARERRRVQAVNIAFSRLRKVVPIDNNRGKRVSKVKTLHKAIEYISQLQDLLLNSDCTHSLMSNNKDLNKENTGQSNNRWNNSNTFESGYRTGGNHTDSLVELLENFEEDF